MTIDLDTVFLGKNDDGEPYIQLGENVLRLERDKIDGVYLEKSMKELRESPENLESALAELRKLIEAEEDLYLPVDDTDFLLKFLRPCKFYPESTFKIIKKFYKFKIKHPKLTTNLTPDEVAKVYADEIIYFLPKRTDNGSRIMVLSIGNWNPKEVNVTKLIKAVLMALEIAMGEPRTQVGGVQLIMDFHGLSLSHVIQFTPGLAKIILSLVQEALAIRLKGVHIINQPTLFNMLYSIFKPFIGDKLKKRIYFHGAKMDALHEQVPVDCLPERWGGCIKSPDCPGEMLNHVLKYYEDEYRELSMHGYRKSESSS